MPNTEGSIGEEGGAQREEKREGEGEGWKVAYQNVGRGIEATNILLDRGREEGWDFIFVGEAWEGKKGERTTQQGYRVYSQQGSKVALYIQEEVNTNQLGKIETSHEWIAIGDVIAGIYLSPNTNMGTLEESLTTLPITDNIIGDANCTQRNRRRTLLEKMTDKGLIEKPIKGNTWRRWHQPQKKWMESKPDVVFSVGNWTTKGVEWTISDHAIIKGNLPSQIRKRRLLTTDWEKWTNFAEDEDKETTYSDPIKSLRKMAEENLKPKKYSPKP